MDNEEFYKQTRAQIEHEDSLLNHRMTWLLAIQGLLFSAFGFTISAEATAVAGNQAYAFKAQLELIRLWLAITGSAAAFTIWIGLVAASLSMGALKRAWSRRQKQQASDHPQLLGGEFMGMLGGLVPVVCLPVVFPIAWSFLANEPPVLWTIGALVIISAVYVLGLIQGVRRSERSEHRQG